MTMPAVDLSLQISQIQARIADVTAQLAADTTTEGESVALGSYLVQLTTSLNQLIDVSVKTRKPYLVRTRNTR